MSRRGCGLFTGQMVACAQAAVNYVRVAALSQALVQLHGALEDLMNHHCSFENVDRTPLTCYDALLGLGRPSKRWAMLEQLKSTPTALASILLVHQ